MWPIARTNWLMELLPSTGRILHTSYTTLTKEPTNLVDLQTLTFPVDRFMRNTRFDDEMRYAVHWHSYGFADRTIVPRHQLMHQWIDQYLKRQKLTLGHRR